MSLLSFSQEIPKDTSQQTKTFPLYFVMQLHISVVFPSNIDCRKMKALNLPLADHYKGSKNKRSGINNAHVCLHTRGHKKKRKKSEEARRAVHLSHQARCLMCTLLRIAMHGMNYCRGFEGGTKIVY